jgi:type III restriction enzyme
MMRESTSMDVGKCIYTRQGWPARNGGLERAFIEWAQTDSSIEAFCKISENRHEFARLRYVKDDGLPAFYFPDFMVRTADATYMVETKSQQQTTHPNVQRKLKAAATWCRRINGLASYDRGGREWHYALVNESVFEDWRRKGARLGELLAFSRIRPAVGVESQGALNL